MMTRGEGLGWFPLAIFGVGAVIALAILIRPHRLDLTPTGMVSFSLGRRWAFEWRLCSEFESWTSPVGSTTLVVFEYSGHHPTPRLGRANARLAGRNASLPDTYGMAAEDLAALLNDYRETARGLTAIGDG